MVSRGAPKVTVYGCGYSCVASLPLISARGTWGLAPLLVGFTFGRLYTSVRVSVVSLNSPRFTLLMYRTWRRMVSERSSCGSRTHRATESLPRRTSGMDQSESLRFESERRRMSGSESCGAFHTSSTRVESGRIDFLRYCGR